MATWKSKKCPRCGGNIFLNNDLDGWYEECLQCSYSNEVTSTVKPKGQPAQREKEPVLG